MKRQSLVPPRRGGLNMPKSVLQDWVMELGLRHQGVLLTAVRGCDTASKEDAGKAFVRAYRGIILNAHVGDPKKSASFIEWVASAEFEYRFQMMLKGTGMDHYPHHYVMHLTHAIQIMGYKHPDPNVTGMFRAFYVKLCKALHVNPESETELDRRLNADEKTFKELQ